MASNRKIVFINEGSLRNLLGPTLSTPLTIAGRIFEVLPDDNRKDYNVTWTKPPGVLTGDWLRFENRDDENNFGEVGNIRGGIDGYRQRFSQRQYSANFDIWPTETTLLQGIAGGSSYMNMHEHHVGKHPSYPSEHENKGCFLLIMEYSAGSGRMILRVRNRYFNKLGPINNANDITDEILWQDSGNQFQPNRLYNFRVETRRNTPGIADGYVRVWWSINGGAETQIVNANNIYHGHGDSRTYWPQFRNYGDNKGVPVVTYFKINNITESEGAFSPYDLKANLLGFWDSDATPYITVDSGNVTSWGEGKNGYVVSEATNPPSFVSSGWTGSTPYIGFNGTTQSLTLTPSPLPSGASPYEMWLVGENDDPGENNVQRWFVSTGDGGNITRGIFRQPSGVNNRLRFAVGTGSSQATNQNLTNLAGKFAARLIVDGTNARLELNNDGSTTSQVAVVPGTATTRLRFGGNSISVPSALLLGKIKAIGFTNLLTGDEATNMWNYVMAKR